MGSRSSTHSYFNKTVTLHDWWLIKPETDTDTDKKALGVAGITSKQNRTAATRCFTSAPISKVFDIFELQTVDGVSIILQGLINKDRTLQSGFSPEVFEHFVSGFPVYWEEFATTCPKKTSTAICVSQAPLHDDGKDSVEEHDQFYDCDNDFVDKEMKDCQDTCFDDKTTTASSPEIPPEHMVNTEDELLCEKTPVTLESEDDPRHVMNPLGIDVDGVKHNVVKKAGDSSKRFVVSSRRMTRSMRKMDIIKNKSVLSHDEVNFLDSVNLASTDSLRKEKNADLSNIKAVDSDVISKSMKSTPKVSGGKEPNETASRSEDMVRLKRKQKDQDVDVTEDDVRNKLTSQVGQEKSKEDIDDIISADLQMDKGRSYLGVKRFKSGSSESMATSVGCQVNAPSSIKDFNFASSVADDPPKANMKACQNKKKNKEEKSPAAHKTDSKKAIMTRSRSKSKVTPQRKMAKRQSPVTTPKSTPRAIVAFKDPYGSPNIVSPEDFSGKKSRSGRVLLPTLEFWRNQKVVYDKDHQVCGIQEPI